MKGKKENPGKSNQIVRPQRQLYLWSLYLTVTPLSLPFFLPPSLHGNDSIAPGLSISLSISLPLFIFENCGSFLFLSHLDAACFFLFLCVCKICVSTEVVQKVVSQIPIYGLSSYTNNEKTVCFFIFFLSPPPSPPPPPTIRERHTPFSSVVVLNLSTLHPSPSLFLSSSNCFFLFH